MMKSSHREMDAMAAAPASMAPIEDSASNEVLKESKSKSEAEPKDKSSLKADNSPAKKDAGPRSEADNGKTLRSNFSENAF